MKHIKSIILTALATCAFVSCADEIIVDSMSVYSDLELDESDIIETQLGVSVNGFSVSVDRTRADDNEVPTEDAVEIMSDFEKAVDNIWVFQYQYGSDGNLLIQPRYYTAKESETDGSWSVLLKPVESNIYVVTNVNDDSWASGSEDFSTTDKLMAATLSEPYTIYNLSEDAQEGHIPMQGHVDKVIPVSGGEAIIVPVEHMYAKVKMRVVLDELLMESEAVKVNYITYSNIPYYCRVGTLYDKTSASKDNSYPSTSTTWISHSFNAPNNSSDPNNIPLQEAGETTYDYVIYVPENIQGENTNTAGDKNAKATGENTPEHASTITVDIHYLDDDGSSQETTFSVCPGGNDYNNYNIRRNQVYRVTLNVSYPNEVIRQPSANCLFGYAGETIAFFPYYRVEAGGGYNFSDYLSPNTESGKGKKIGGLKIIWQTKDCIGDNSKGDLVYLVSTTGDDTHNGYEEIYVKTQKEGNALIAAYDKDPFTNEDAEIIWSWHIWVRDKQYSDPTNLANAMVYYTYEWDETRVYSYDYYTGLGQTPKRVPGYQIMSCNVGALQDTPSDYEEWDAVARTFGTLYQWGRKDPFPPMIKEQDDPGDYSDDLTGPHYGNDNETPVGKDSSTADAEFLFHTHVPQESDGMAYTIMNPTVFMCGMTSIDGYAANSDYSAKGNYTLNGAWSEEDHDNKEWGGLEPDTTGEMKRLGFEFNNTWGNPIEVYDNYGTEKSIFDPCPYGWRVPPADLWMGFLKNGINDYYNPLITDNKSDANMDNVNYDPNRSSKYGMSMYLGNTWRSGETSYFPCQGFRFGNGKVYRVGTCGCYANANVRLEDNLNCLHLHDAATYTKAIETSAAYTVKCSAGSIRCVRDTK